MERIAQIGIIIEDVNMAGTVNNILHEYNDYILGRMGLPYKEKNVNIISIVMYAGNDTINRMVGLLGQISNVSAKALFAKNV